MTYRLQLIIEDENGEQQPQEIALFERQETTQATLGLSLSEGKELLQQLQQAMACHQVGELLDKQKPCPHCKKQRQSKGQGPHPAPYRTPFGKVLLPNPRWKHCSCQSHESKTFRPLAQLLDERTSPELLYLESKWASLLPYGVTTKLLHDVLPLDQKHNSETVRNHLHLVAKRSEDALNEKMENQGESCQQEPLPIPDGPLTIGLDGAYVRARQPKESSEQGPVRFEVITGKSILAFRRAEPEGTEPTAKCFGFVHTHEKHPQRRLLKLLESQGLQANQRITFLTDGGDTVKDLPFFINNDSEQILDWFHITMRMTVLGQCAQGLRKVEQLSELGEEVESIKHYLWHGNLFQALQRIDGLIWDLDLYLFNEKQDPMSQKIRKMLGHVRDLHTYISNNQYFIPNYGERYRNGETISTAIAESTVNQVVSKRMVKKQQMQWTHEGAHLLLQVRTTVLNEDLEEQFQQRYPGFSVEAPKPRAKAA